MIRMSRDAGSCASASTNALGPANGSATIPSSERSSTELRAIFSSRAWNVSFRCRVALERLVVPEVDELLDRLVDRPQRAHLTGGHAALGGEPRGRALQHTPQLDRVANVGLRELPHDVAAARQAAQQALVLELGEREPQRRARDTQALHQRQLGHPLARGRTRR